MHILHADAPCGLHCDRGELSLPFRTLMHADASLHADARGEGSIGLMHFAR